MQPGAELIVVKDMIELIDAAAKRIAARILQAGDGRIAVCLTGGATPAPVYERLAVAPYRSELPWDRIHWFWTDDRFVPPGDPLSNAGMARRTLLDRIPVPPGTIHQIPTAAANPDEAATLYEAELKRFHGSGQIAGRPLFDLVLMGLGPDGHTASLFPGRAALDEKERWAIGVEDPGFDPRVPRVTLALPILAATREMLFLVSGEDKRAAFAKVRRGDDLPAARAYADGALAWMVDRAAAPDG
jgi:6-phosphogluconolactonase